MSGGPYRFQVITKVPVPPEAGNMACTIDVCLANDGPDGEQVQPLVDVNPHLVFSLRTPVFTLGEIVIVTEYGREVCNPGRKASKWLVEYEEFDNLDDAVARSRSVAGLSAVL